MGALGLGEPVDRPMYYLATIGTPLLTQRLNHFYLNSLST